MNINQIYGQCPKCGAALTSGHHCGSLHALPAYFSDDPKKHWLDKLTLVFGPHAQIDVLVDPMREVILRVRETGSGRVYRIECYILWSEFENWVDDPLAFAADVIIDEWRKRAQEQGSHGG